MKSGMFGKDKTGSRQQSLQSHSPCYPKGSPNTLQPVWGELVELREKMESPKIGTSTSCVHLNT